MLTIRLDVESLSRLQFALTIMFHYLFPPLTIGLSVIMVIIEGLALKTGDRVYENMARFWTKIFALNFVMGVITGVVMEFQFGTNWATYSRFVGDVFGSALAAEGIFAFFLESGFLAVLVFGWDRVSPRFHFLATVLVSLGGMFSAVWIVVANSWQQTPAGFHIAGQGAQARAEITDFWAMVFNPSSADRLIHTLLGSFVLGAFFVMSISAYYILKDRHLEFARRSFRIALFCAFFSSMLIIVSGHHQAQVTAQTQPAKLAAFEGHFRQTSGPAPIYIFGIPDSKNETVRFGIPLPGLLSFLVHGSFNRPVTALDEIPPSDRPPVAVPFFAYHLM
ncbi:MAG TPA: cytochrome ubiquinol oxidase subunit I, partial [Oligoflexia bacterium]|nr:cytochrome ubiquinol oxidase subunit I [Oligoflexia bacterium]